MPTGMLDSGEKGKRPRDRTSGVPGSGYLRNVIG